MGRSWRTGRGAVAVVVLLVSCWLRPPARLAGPWVWPLDGAREVGRPFAPGATRWSAGHYGADLPAPQGAAVRAAGAGRVSYAGLLAGRGVVVVVHGALRTTYEPVAAAVAVGDQVAAGQLLGRVAGAHASCGAGSCLHWGLRRGEDYLDPVRLLGGPVRLLPVGGVASRGRGGGDGREVRGREVRGRGGSARGHLGRGGLRRRRGPRRALVLAQTAPRPPTVPAPRSRAPRWTPRRCGPRVAPEPGSTLLSLRRSDLPLTSLALVALLAGLALVRSSPRPTAPPRAGAPSTAARAGARCSDGAPEPASTTSARRARRRPRRRASAAAGRRP